MSRHRRRHEADVAAEAQDVDPSELKGKDLDAALEAAGLPKTGTADEKRERLVEHLTAPADGEQEA